MKIDGVAEKVYTFTFSLTQDEFDAITAELDNAIGYDVSLAHRFWPELYNVMAEHYED